MLKVCALRSTLENASKPALVNLPKAVARKKRKTVNVGVVSHVVNLDDGDNLGDSVRDLLLDDGFIHGEYETPNNVQSSGTRG